MASELVRMLPWASLPAVSREAEAGLEQPFLHLLLLVLYLFFTFYHYLRPCWPLQERDGRWLVPSSVDAEERLCCWLWHSWFFQYFWDVLPVAEAYLDFCAGSS